MSMEWRRELLSGQGVPASAGVRSATKVDRWLATMVQRRIERGAVRLMLWDGSSPYAGSSRPIGDIVVHDRRALLGLAVNPDLYFGEGYMFGRIDVRGELEPMLEAVTRVTTDERSWRDRLQDRLTFRNTPTRARRNVHHHYDIGNSFYKLWLDADLVYTCAYFADPAMSLEEAQFAKLDLICRKLRLEPGATVVEAGCGWGALALHMARHYGAQVKAFNVSREQLAYARARAAREGLSRRVEFIDDDYRNIDGEFDAFVSVGMLEHVGTRQYRALSEVIARSVRRRGGRGLLHFIGRDVPRPLNPWITRRIFPGAYPPTLGEVAEKVLGPARMSIVDVDNLRLHYARTLDAWRCRYLDSIEQVRAMYGETFSRAWELYLAGSEAAFAAGCLQLFQVVFSPYEAAPPYWTRAGVYDGGEGSSCAALTR